MATQERQARSFLPGLGLLILIFALAAFVFFLDDLLRAARGRTIVVAVMTEARNVRQGAPVWIAGKQVGQVKTIEILPRGADTTARVALQLQIEQRYLDQLNAGSRVRLASDRLIGEAAIDVVPGAPTTGPFSPGDTLYARRPISVSTLMQRAIALNAAVDSLNAASAEITAAAARRRAAVPGMQRALQGLQREFTMLSEDLRSAPGLRAAEDPQLRDGLERLGVTARRLSAMFDSAGARGTTTAADVAAGLAALQQRTRALAEEIDALQALMNESGTLARLQRDSALLRAFQGVRASLDSLVAEAGRNPGRFVF